MRINSKYLKKYLNIDDVIEYKSDTIIFNGNNLKEEDIYKINNIDIERYILEVADKKNKYLLSNNYYSSSSLYSKNDKSIRQYGLETNLFILPICDVIYSIINRLIDEFVSYEFKSLGYINSFLNRSYELYKMICDDLDDDYIVVYDMNESDFN